MNHDRTVIITGAAGGIGSLLVNRFLTGGDTVIATDTDQQVLDARLSEWHSRGRLITVAADISSEEECHRVAQTAHRETGHVDILITCAGLFPFVPFEEMKPQDWRKVIDVNLTGTFLTTHAVLPIMKERGWGRIINFGSRSVFDGTAGYAHYVAAKAGIVGFSRSLAREVGGYGITVNVVTPGLTVTPAVRDHMRRRSSKPSARGGPSSGTRYPRTSSGRSPSSPPGTRTLSPDRFSTWMAE